jgi:hypothetical protein
MYVLTIFSVTASIKISSKKGQNYKKTYSTNARYPKPTQRTGVNPQKLDKPAGQSSWEPCCADFLEKPPIFTLINPQSYF